MQVPTLHRRPAQARAQQHRRGSSSDCGARADRQAQRKALHLLDQGHPQEDHTSGLQQVAVYRTRMTETTRAAVSVGAGSKHRLETTTPTHPPTMVAHRSVVPQAGAALAYPADHACAESLCTYSTGAFGVAGHSRVGLDVA